MNFIREKNSPSVCVTGMHRSGTSTVTQLLSKCGLSLGRELDLFAAGPANPDGYWENKHFVAVSREILEVFGGGWDFVPDLPSNWQNDVRLLSLRTRAETLSHEFEGKSPWGWKDPRCCLTLPFWRIVLPDVKVVVCLRNPLEVARSLRKRGNSSFAFGFNLWMVHYKRLLDELESGQYIVTHYESYFHRPMQEVRRVLDFLEMPASEQRIAQARTSTIKSLRNHTYGTEELLAAKPPQELPGLYERLCKESRWEPELLSTPGQS